MKDKIWLSSPHMGGDEIKFVQEAFDENWIAPLGPNVNGFEKDLENYLGEGVHVAALSSGTAAIHLALILLDVKEGDEVICQSMTFSASANPIVYQHATPVFIDSEEETWNMCPKALREAIEDRIAKGKKPKAIIAVHLYGMPAKMQEIITIANEFNIPVIEDAAEALGSHINGQKCGTFGTFGILSFNGNKIITTSGGGALVSRDEGLIQKSRYLATQARDPAPHYQHTQIGYNYRMSNVCAGIGRGQMKVLDERVAARRANYEFYVENFGNVAGFSFVAEPQGYFSNRWLSTVLIEGQGFDTNTVREHLEKDNIESRPLWKPMHMQPVFEKYPYYGGNVAERLFEKGLCLPSGSNLSKEDLDRVLGEVKEVVE